MTSSSDFSASAPSHAVRSRTNELRVTRVDGSGGKAGAVRGRTLFGSAATPLIALADRYGHRSAVAYVTIPAAEVARVGRAPAQDALLTAVRARLDDLHRKSDLVARASVNSFAVLLSHLWEAEGCYAAARRLVTELSRPYQIGDREVVVPVRIGLSVRPEDGDTLDVLIAMAVGASVEAAETDVTLRFANSYLGDELVRRDAMQQSMAAPANLSQFAVAYQPIFSLATLEPVGAESLLRWNHPTLGHLTAAEFVPEAERSGRIRSLDRWVASQAIPQAASWHGWKGWVSINLSAHSIADSGMVDHLRDAVTAASAGGIRTVVEVTESAALSNPNETLRVLQSLREQDILVAVDDFGTGYSSLEYVSMFEADMIKLDRSFIHEIEEVERRRRLLVGLINMSHHMNIPLVAEGVETPGQQEILTEAGCDMVQGFYFGEPTAPEDFVPRFLRSS